MESDRGERYRRGHRHTVELHRRRNGDAPPEPERLNMSGRQEPLVVPTAQLAPLVSAALDAHRASFPAGSENGTWTGKVMTGPIQWLSFESGIQERVIQRILRQEHTNVGLRIADPVLQALGLPHATYDGTVDVIPNPLLSPTYFADLMWERGCY
jgi:hypothetical protein